MSPKRIFDSRIKMADPARIELAIYALGGRCRIQARPRVLVNMNRGFF